MLNESEEINASTRIWVSRAVRFLPSGIIRIIIADDQTLFRAGLRSLLAREPDFQVVGEAADGCEALELLRATETDVLLLNPKMPTRYGESLLDELQSSAVPTKTIILADRNNPKELMAALAKGARGCVVKQSGVEQLREAIRTVHGGKIWLDVLFTGGRHLNSSDSGFEDCSDSILAKRLWTRLTPRERQIAALFSQGRLCRDIAAKLSISEGTARSHLHRIYIKLRVSNRRQLRVCELSAQLQPAVGAPGDEAARVFDRVA